MLNRPEQFGTVQNRAWRVIRENGTKEDEDVRDDNSASFIQLHLDFGGPVTTNFKALDHPKVTN